jgi:endoglucanase
MIDEIYEQGGEDVPLETALIMGLGYVNGTKVAKEIIANNPSWTIQTTRFEIWSHIASAALSRSIFVHPDVHVGYAKWVSSCITTATPVTSADYPVLLTL